LAGFVAGLLAAGALTIGTADLADAKRKRPKVKYWLTVLHNNDGESQLINAGEGLEDFGGVARFATLVNNLRAQNTRSHGVRRAAIMLSSGDNFLAGPEFNASLEENAENGDPFYDSVALSLVGYDAMAIGNHEFDFGPDVLAEFIEGFGTVGVPNSGIPPFLSSNLNVDAEPRLDALEEAGIISGSTVVTKQGQRIGVVGATTPALPTISSPRNVVVDEDVAGAVQAEVDALTAEGVNKVILISHLQSVEQDRELAGMLSKVDVMIAGGGDELLANRGDVLVPGDEGDDEDGDGVGDNIFGPYPLIEEDADGREVPIVTTPGNYKYVGALKVGFSQRGEVVRIRDASGLQRVAGGDQPDAVEPDGRIQRWVVEPVTEALAQLAETVVAETEVALDGRRSQVRTVETNLGNLIADGFLVQADKLNESFGAPQPDVAIQNGGGIRNDSIIPAGELTELDTFDILPFGNFLAISEGVDPGLFLAQLEQCVSNVEAVDGRFCQVSGFEFTYDKDVAAGERVISATLDDGTVMVSGGEVAPTAVTVDIAMSAFSANGGDGYPVGARPFTTLGQTDQQTLRNFLVDDLGGVVPAADYPEGGEGRITEQ
jgi:5'-nucleotidase